jgi:hypothetical protein
MDSKNTNSKADGKEEQEFPGYPHYPAGEDITKSDNNSGKLPVDEGSIELPDVSDIPGQEHITVPPRGELADTTISSADEEDIVSGDSLDGPAGDEEDEVKIVMGTEADVTKEDLQLLGAIDRDLNEDEVLARDILEDTDDEGELLNEVNSTSDLDVPGSEDDDMNEEIGEEDEENNYYSLGSDSNDNLEAGDDR